jgi:hypothetical protein
MEAVYDLSATAWVRERIVTFAHDVGSLVPAGFEAYARVLHPAGPGEVRWAEIARQLGRTVHPEAQFQNVATPPGMDVPAQQHDVRGPWTCPWTGKLPEPLRNHMGRVLSRFTTTTNRVWFALWEGYGGLKSQSHTVWQVARRPGEVIERPVPSYRHPSPEEFEARPGRPLLELPYRRYLVYLGALGELSSWRWEGPNLWWPQDRAWFLASEIDLVSTYVGGPAAAVEALLHDSLLEVVPSSITDRITADADRINI